MRLLDTIWIPSKTGEKRVRLKQGDLTRLTPDEHTDLLLISAFCGNYVPTTTSLIGALARSGLDVRELARDKEVDLRSSFMCWLSKPIPHLPGLEYQRIACYEPNTPTDAPRHVAGVFRALIPLLYEDVPLTSVAMPLLATGHQCVPLSQMFPSLVDAAVHWLAQGLPLDTVDIVVYTELEAEQVLPMFRQIKAAVAKEIGSTPFRSSHDYFISYSHADADEAEHLVAMMSRISRETRLFVDRPELECGCSWQKRLYEAVESCDRVVALISPSYLDSEFCIEEFNLAVMRDREEGGDVLLPIYLRSANLPLYMRARQYMDCREADLQRLRDACERLASCVARSKRAVDETRDSATGC